MIERSSQDALSVPTSPAEDRRLIDRCLSGDHAAWDVLYRSFHQKLLISIRRMLGANRADPNLVDEIAARVWYAAISDDGQLLTRFDPEQNCRLTTFLAAIARGQLVAIFRSEKRRRRREALVSRLEHEAPEQSQQRTDTEIHDFLKTLSTREREFCVQVLLEPKPHSPYSKSNAWQLRSRIHAKLREFVVDARKH